MSISAPVAEFIATWRDSTLKESSGAQSHFNHLCRLLDLTEPAIADPQGEWFTFEKGAKKRGGGDGWADVWKKGCFAWEYKGKGKDLAAALRQLQQYAPALENPPFLTGQSFDAGGVDLTQAKRLVENAKISFMGVTKSGPFDISGDLARVWLDEAVAAAYGWPVDLSDDEALRRLLALNQERAGNSIGAAAANRRT